MEATREQIPLGNTHALTVDRAMSQTLAKAAVDCRRHIVDAPGHWYVGFSRTTSAEDMLIVADRRNVDQDGGVYVNNTAYKVLIQKLLKEGEGEL